jgi:hypothetical protein
MQGLNDHNGQSQSKHRIQVMQKIIMTVPHAEDFNLRAGDGDSVGRDQPAWDHGQDADRKCLQVQLQRASDSRSRDLTGITAKASGDIASSPMASFETLAYHNKLYNVMKRNLPVAVLDSQTT